LRLKWRNSPNAFFRAVTDQHQGAEAHDNPLSPALIELLVSNHREDMMAGGVDLALRFGPPHPSALIARKILETRIITCASPSYLARRGTPKVPQDIANHEALLFRDSQSGRPFSWEFHRRKNVVEIPVDGRVVMDDLSAALAACEAGQGLFQSFELGLAQWLASGKLVQVLPEWSDERFAFMPIIIPRAGRRQPSDVPSRIHSPHRRQRLSLICSHWQPFVGNDQMVYPGRISADTNSQATDRYPPFLDDASIQRVQVWMSAFREA
jgi:DNA-binding transcriptional LysR family regulator